MSQFRLGLSEQIKDELARVETPNDFEAFIQLCIRVDQRLNERRKEKFRMFGTGEKSMRFSFPSTQRNPNVLPDSMQIDAIRRSISTQEKERRCSRNGKADALSQTFSESSVESHLGCTILPQKNFLGAMNTRKFFLEVLQQVHDSKLAGHFRAAKMAALISCSFWWPGYRKDAKNYVLPSSKSLTLPYGQSTLKTATVTENELTYSMAYINIVQSSTLCHPSGFPIKATSHGLKDCFNISSEPVTQETLPILTFTASNHHELLKLNVIALLLFAIILAIPLFRAHNPQINWGTGEVKFSSEYCKQHCLLNKPTIFLEMNVEEEPHSLVSQVNQEFMDMFNKKGAKVLPTHLTCDYPIELLPGAQIPFGLIYTLLEGELEALKEYVEDNIKKRVHLTLHISGWCRVKKLHTVGLFLESTGTEHTGGNQNYCLSVTQCTNQTGSTCKMGMIKLSVKDYMSSLHSYMETPPAAKRDGGEKHAAITPTSISEMLKLCEADPVELLIDLGFGTDEPDICTKIPARFIMTPSEARGINTRVFIEAQKRRMEIENPNLCGRFRQLEVLEQVTSAFSSLLNDVHFVRKTEDTNLKKSTLTQEKRKRIRQLLWKFSRQAKIVDENPSPCMVTDGLTEKQDEHEPLKDTENVNVLKRTHSTDQENAEVLSKEQLSTTDNGNVSPLRPEGLNMLYAPAKQYNLNEMAGKIRTLRGCKVLSKTFRKASAQNKLQPPDSFELEEVQSFEEDYPKALNQDRISEITRTNSCQSDSSGFQEDPPEPLPLKNLHGSSDSIDSQVTLHGKSSSSEFPDITEEYDDVHDFATPLVTENATVTSTSRSLQTDKDTYKSLSINTENSDDLFQSFESHNDHFDDMKELDQQKPMSEDTENEMEEINNGIDYLKDGEQEDQMDHRQTQTPVSSEVEYPIYVTHYLSDIRKTHPEFSSETDDQDSFEGHVSLQVKSDSESNSFADDECSVVSSSVKWTSSPMSRSQSFSFHAQTPPGSVDYSDHELHQKSTFQTEINTNIYKSVTIQMSAHLQQDQGECSSRQHSLYSTSNDRNEVHALLNCVADRKDASSQTEIGWLDECYTNNHCSHQRSHFLHESHSFDTALWVHHHSSHSVPNIACCHCCHSHHCCISGCPTTCRHNVPIRPSSPYINIERELSDTLSLLRESLIDLSLSRDDDLEKMRKACQTYREKLLETEQDLLEQQAGCFNILTSEERETIRRLHLLRQDVLREATELEFNLDERARHVKEAISVQLEQVLQEQSRLYSELEFSDLNSESRADGRRRNFYKSQSFPSTSASNVPEEVPEIKTNSVEADTQSQKIDFSTILQNIKKTFRSFNN
ncbi:protein ITPRID1 [Mantella aurantiaca]